MSLGSDVQSPKTAVGAWMREHLPQTPAVVRVLNRHLLDTRSVFVTPPAGCSVGTLGTAIDYGIRFALHACDVAELVAVHGAHNAEEIVPPALSVAFFEHVDHLLHGPAPPGCEAELARCCYVLALFDECFRAGPAVVGSVSLAAAEIVRAPATPLAGLRPGGWLADLLGLVPDDAVSDILAVVGLLGETAGGHRLRELASTGLVCNPSFPGYPGGADADLVAGGCLVEVKAGSRGTIEGRTVHQTVGYALLDRSAELGVHSIAFYLARGGTLLRFALPRILAVLSGTMPTHEVFGGSTDDDERIVKDLRESFRAPVETERREFEEAFAKYGLRGGGLEDAVGIRPSTAPGARAVRRTFGLADHIDLATRRVELAPLTAWERFRASELRREEVSSRRRAQEAEQASRHAVRRVEQRRTRWKAAGIGLPAWEADADEWPTRCTSCNRQTSETWTLGAVAGVCARCAKSAARMRDQSRSDNTR